MAVDGTAGRVGRVRCWTLAVGDDAGDGHQKRGGLAPCSERQIGVGTLWRGKRHTWDGVAIEGLDLVLGGGYAGDELSHAIDALERFAVPCQSRVGAIEVRQVVEARGRIIGRVVEASEVVRRSRGDLDAARGTSDRSGPNILSDRKRKRGNGGR